MPQNEASALSRLRRWFRRPPVVPVIRLTGLIGLSTPLRPGITMSGVARQIDRAFDYKRARAVALSINSPGGSPVQSHLIYRRIRQRAEEKKLPVYAFVEDAGASGGYMLACAGDEIVCDVSSVVGSIGVVGATFGFDRAIAKLGIERRVYTAGEHKVSLDPFLPEDPDDVARLMAIQHDIHLSFIDLVKTSRGGRLKGPESALFSGEYWAGRKALEYGLVDGLGDLRSVLRQRFGEEVRLPVMAERGWLARRLSGTRQFPAGLGDEILSALEARALWARYGL